MDGNQASTQLSAQQSTNSQTISLRDAPLSTIHEAIRSPSDPGATLKRVNAVLGQYYDPDFDPETKALVREEFVRALLPYPVWAMHKAFDEWTRTMQRRPSPAEIVILIGRAIQPFTREIAEREKLAQRIEDEKRAAEISPAELEQRRAFAASIVARAGYAMTSAVKRTPPTEGYSADEIADTIARVTANAAAREAEAQRRADVARQIAIPQSPASSTEGGL